MDAVATPSQVLLLGYKEQRSVPAASPPLMLCGPDQGAPSAKGGPPGARETATSIVLAELRSQLEQRVLMRRHALSSVAGVRVSKQGDGDDTLLYRVVSDGVERVEVRGH